MRRHDRRRFSRPASGRDAESEMTFPPPARLTTWKTLTALCLAAFLPAGASAAGEGLPYRQIDPPVNTGAEDSRIEVIEFFWYGCPHCYSLEPHLEKWLGTLPEDVRFKRVPAPLAKSWLAHAKAYYVALELGVVDQIHSVLFRRIHEHDRRLNDKKSLKGFFARMGVEERSFERLYSSERIEDYLKRDLLLTKRTGIDSVPTLLVGGQYAVTRQLAGSNEKVIETVNDLIDRLRRRTSASATDDTSTWRALEDSNL